MGFQTLVVITNNSDINGSELYQTRDSVCVRRIYLENRLHRDTNQLLEFIITTETPYLSEQVLFIQQSLLIISNIAAELIQIYGH